nr:uncharacterized protein LOC125987496 [Syngnathus scovelli]
MRRLQASKLWLERSPMVLCALHWWWQRTSSLQHGSTGGAGDQEMRCHDQLPVQHFDSPVSSRSSVGRSTCQAKKFSKTMLKAGDKAPAAQAKLWQAEDEPSAVWCTIEYLLTPEARAKADANYTLVFLLRPHLQGNLRSEAHLHLGGTHRPLCHSSDWPTTLPLVRLADHFATRPTGRPLRHSSDWPTTSPLVNEQTAVQLEILVIECLLCKIKFDYKEYFNSHFFILKHQTLKI